MRGQSVFSYALVAFATITYAAPLVERTEVELRLPYVIDGKAFSGTDWIVDIGKEFVEHRKYIIARASTSTVSRASMASKPGVAKSTGAKASATSNPGTAKATGATASKATSKPGAAKATGATKATATKGLATSKPAAAKATTPADLPGCPAPAGKASTGSGGAKATAAARRANKPLGCDPTKPQVS